MTNLNLSGARAKLLFVGNPIALIRKYPNNGVLELFQEIKNQARLLEVDNMDPVELAKQVRRSLGDADGVVILGGYDTIPSQRVYCVPPESTATPRDDPNDGFIVWSDDIYGDVDDDGLPELPVSRVPDAGSFAFLEHCLCAPDFNPSPPYGLVNKFRPFADKVFRDIKDSTNGNLQHSSPVNLKIANRQPDWKRNRVGYLLLHGEISDGTVFRGQRTPANKVEALRLDNVPALDGGFIFTGCCWGGLVVDTTAADARPGQDLGVRTPESSIALAALLRGAVAFIGSTGVVQSPQAWDAYGAPVPDDDYYCKPLHDAFWQRCAEGLPPALALLEAKLDYFAGIQHPGATNVSSDVQIAVELKQFREMTCLGLGW